MNLYFFKKNNSEVCDGGICRYRTVQYSRGVVVAVLMWGGVVSCWW